MKKVLVLDDNEDILQVVTEVLAYGGFEVNGISHGEELFAAAETYCPDLILLDLLLPDAHGGDLSRRLKSHPDFKHIPVVIITAYSHPDENFANYCCDAVISKPFDLDELIRTVDQLTPAN